jgi:hypothetical protein
MTKLAERSDYLQLEAPDRESHGILAATVTGEVQEQEVWAQRRHDLEMRHIALVSELDRALARLHSLLERYEALQAERAQADPPIPETRTIPARLRPLVAVASHRLRAGASARLQAGRGQ